MADAIKVNIVTPRGVLAETAATFVTAPGELGEFQVLPGHLPLLAALKPGVMTLGGAAAVRYAVGAGYLRIDDKGQVEVLVDQAVKGSDVDAAAARADLKAAETELATWVGAIEGEWHVIQSRKAWAQARLDVSSN